MWKYLTQVWAHLKSKYGYKIYIFLAIIFYSIVSSAIALTIYYSFQIYTWDLGVFNQALWTTLNGRLFYYTSEPFYTSTGSFLGAHFGPILFLFIPIYALFPRPENLLVLNTVIIALGAIPAYEIAQLLLKNEKVATMLGLFYLLYLPLQGVTLSGFSLESIAVTLFLFIILYLLKGDFKKLLLVVLLGLATHEASAPVIAFIGLYGMWYYKSPKNRKFQASLIIFIASIVYFVFAQNMRIFFGWTQRPSLWHEWSLIGAQGPTDLPFKILVNPVGAWSSLTFEGPMKVSYVLMFLVPAAFLPLFGVQGLLPAVPYLFLSLFSSYGLYYSIENHYGAFIAPFFFVALIHGIIKLQRSSRFHFSALKLSKVVLVLSVMSLITILPIIYTKHGIFQGSGEHEGIVYDFMAQIPQNASVLTQNNIFPHLSSRANAYTIPPPSWAEEYRQVGEEILLNLSKTKIDYVLIDLNSEPHSASGGALILSEFVLKSKRYDPLMQEDGVILFKLTGV